MKMGLVVDLLPAFAAELSGLLSASEEPELADQMPGLELVDRCRCGDSFCATFYTQPPPVGAYGPSHYNVVLDPTEGMIILDIVEQRIACVEVLYREDIRTALASLLP